jgi:hypothetical protein
MEEVKTKVTLHTPDIRRTMIVVINNKTGAQRPFSFADVEGRVSDIPIPPAAPEDVKDLLVTAKNLLLYSWYYFPFSMSASLQAAAALERALRLKLNATERDTLSFLLREAVKKGHLTTAGFKRWTQWREAFAQLHSKGRKAEKANLAKLLSKTLPHFRNTLAHGNRFVDDSGFLHLDIVCEAIEQLYPTSGQPASGTAAAS